MFIPKILNSLSRATIYRSVRKMRLKKLVPRPVHIKKSQSTCVKWLKNIRITIYRYKKKYSQKKLEVYFQDETRYGQQTINYKILAKRGSRPIYKKQHGFLNSWIYGAINSESGKKFGLVLPKLNSENMQMFLNKFSKTINHNKQVLLILDGSSAHRAKSLTIPKNIFLHFLQPYSPELNPIERLWLYIKKNYLSFKLYKNQSKLIQTGAEAWNRIDKEMIQKLCKCNFIEW